MLTDWLIYLDFLEENNQNTTFVRLITPIIFGIFECHYCKYTKGDGYGNGYGNGSGNGYGYDYGNGNGYGTVYNYLNAYNEEH